MALASVGPLSIPPLLLFAVIPSLPLSRVIPAVTSQEAVSEKEGGRTVPRAGNGSSFPITCNGVHAALSCFFSCLQGLLPRLEVATPQSPSLGGVWLCPWFQELAASARQPESSPVLIQNLSKGNNYCILSYLYFCCIFSLM